MSRRLELPDGLEADLDDELLADLVEAVQQGHPPSQAALEEAEGLAGCRPGVARVLRRRRALHVVAAVRAANPAASKLAVAYMAARRLGESAETIRWWARGVDSPRPLADAASRPADAGDDGGTT